MLFRSFTSSRNSSRSRLGSSSDYEADLLPKANGSAPSTPRSHIWLTRRYTKLFVATLIAFGLFFSVVTVGSRWRLELRRVSSGGPVLAVDPVDPESDRLPPDWARFREYELQTSEQHGDYPNTKYFFSANHARSESVSSYANREVSLSYATMAHICGRSALRSSSCHPPSA